MADVSEYQGLVGEKEFTISTRPDGLIRSVVARVMIHSPARLQQIEPDGQMPVRKPDYFVEVRGFTQPEAVAAALSWLEERYGPILQIDPDPRT